VLVKGELFNLYVALGGKNPQIGEELGKQFLPRDSALVHSAVLRLHVVRPSVCPSVTLVDQDHNVGNLGN